MYRLPDKGIVIRTMRINRTADLYPQPARICPVMPCMVLRIGIAISVAIIGSGDGNDYLSKSSANSETRNRIM